MSMRQAETETTAPAEGQFEESRFQALGLTTEELEEIKYVFSENIGNDEFNERTLERIKLPAGGLTVWQVNGSEGVKHMEALQGLILQFNRTRAMWFERRKPGEPARPPDCYSLDGEKGNYRHQPPGTTPEKGEPGGDCFSCRYNQPYSHPEKPESRARGCPEKRMLFMLTKDRMMPVVVQLPVTSIGNFNSYKNQLFNEFKRLSRVITEISLEADENETGDSYSKAVFRNVGNINDIEKIGMSRYEEHCLKQLNEYLQEANRRQLMQGDLDDMPALGPGEEDGPVPPGEMPSSMQPALAASEPADKEGEAPAPAQAPPAGQVVETTGKPVEGQNSEDATAAGDAGATESEPRPAPQDQESQAPPAGGAEPQANAVVDDPFGESMFDHNEEILAAQIAEQEPSPPGEPFNGMPEAVKPSGAASPAAPTLFQ